MARRRGAPASLILAGALGGAADRLDSFRERGGGTASTTLARSIGAVAAVGILGTVGEAALLHFRGAFHNPVMWVPVGLPPVATAYLMRDVSRGQTRRATVGLLVATAVAGVAGVVFHSIGVARNMGGWRNWQQNILAGPPVPAPPAFVGLAIAAIGALQLLRKRGG